MHLAYGKVLALAFTLALATVQGLLPCATALCKTPVSSALPKAASLDEARDTSGDASRDTAGDAPARTSSHVAKEASTSASKDALAETFVLPALPRLAARPRATVTQVPDGDTLRLADRRTIRLACIDAPDLSLSRPSTVSNEELRKGNFRAEAAESVVGKNDDKARANASKPNASKPNASKPNASKPNASKRNVPDQYFAKDARDALKRLVLNRQVILRGALLKKDRQGRIVADVCLEDGTSLSAWLVGNGHAYVVYDPDYPEDIYAALVQLQVEAMSHRRGFWAVLLGTNVGNITDNNTANSPGNNHTFVGNAETRLFYSSENVRSQQIKPRQRTYFGTLLDAFSSGYAPANSREFWPTAE